MIVSFTTIHINKDSAVVLFFIIYLYIYIQYVLFY